MCGIIGIVSKSKFFSEKLGIVIKKCLKNLEYRGYDSVGFAIISNDKKLIVKKSKGKIDDVVKKLRFNDFDGVVGIGHTRWATHGAPTDVNAHPHTDCKGRIAVVHNGIIENYLEIKDTLVNEGHVFRSETDTEVVSHLIEKYKSQGLNTFEAFKKAVSTLKGAYALAVIDLDEPDKIFFARKTSPLVVGIANGAVFVASDIPAFLEYTRKVIVLRDGEVGYITSSSVHIEELGKGPIDITYRVKTIEWTSEMAKKGGYPHFMLKEIHEQPQALASTLAGLGYEIEEIARIISRAERVMLVGAGTSFHAALVAQYLFTGLANTWSQAIISSEAKWLVRGLREGDVVIAISQSGETIDTLTAVRYAKQQGACTIAISNVIDSAIPRETHYAIYTRAGPEIGVAATKTFTTQVVLLTYIALKVAKTKKSLPSKNIDYLITELEQIPDIASKVITFIEAKTRRLAKRLAHINNAFYLGRGLGVPIAMEGALKLKEIAYIHAEAYPAGESKHGPIALVERGFPVIFTVLNDESYELILSNIEEMRAREAWIISIAPHNATEVRRLSHEIFELPNISPELTPAIYIIPYQLLAYYTATTRGYDPDKPRNLAKTVTVI